MSQMYCIHLRKYSAGYIDAAETHSQLKIISVGAKAATLRSERIDPIISEMTNA